MFFIHVNLLGNDDCVPVQQMKHYY